jgi:hypothetical protein
MRLYTTILFCIICFSKNTFAQKHDYLWFLSSGMHSSGYSTVFNFHTVPYTMDTIQRNMPMNRASNTVCDTAGNLMFYTNGIWINNANHQLMQNGDSLNPSPYTDQARNIGFFVPESTTAIPHPKQPNKYYLFHKSWEYNIAVEGFLERLYYTLIDMNANNGLGVVERKNQILLSGLTDSIGGQLEVVKHANGYDWWLLQCLSGSNGFHTFLITGDTIQMVRKQYIGNSNRSVGNENIGQAVFTPDGTKYIRYDSYNELDIFDFNRCTGRLSNPIHIEVDTSIYGGGLSISPSSRYLYVSLSFFVVQFDLWATDIAASMDTIAVYDGSYTIDPLVGGHRFQLFQLAPDGKIYGNIPSSPYLHVINQPDLAGDSCDLQQHAITLPYYNGQFLPNNPHYRMAALPDSACAPSQNGSGWIDEEEVVYTSTQDIKAGNVFRLYPNPAGQQLTIELDNITNTTATVFVYNALGQLVLTQEFGGSTTALDVQSLAAGAYFCQIMLSGKLYTQQFAVVK